MRMRQARKIMKRCLIKTLNGSVIRRRKVYNESQYFEAYWTFFRNRPRPNQINEKTPIGR